MLDNNMQAQLKAYLEKLTKNLSQKELSDNT